MIWPSPFFIIKVLFVAVGGWLNTFQIKLLQAPQFKIKISNKISDDTYIEPSIYWYTWCFLSSSTVVAPIIIIPSNYGHELSLLFFATFGLSILIMFSKSSYAYNKYSKLVHSKYWTDSPIFQKIKQDRTLYPYLWTSFWVYFYIWANFQWGDKFYGYTNKINSSDWGQFLLLSIPLIIIIVFILVVKLFSKYIFKQPWFDSCLKNPKVPNQTKEFLRTLTNIPPSNHSTIWRRKEDLARIVYRTSIYKSFFTNILPANKTSSTKSIPFRFIFILLASVSLPYFILLAVAATIGILDVKKDFASPIIGLCSIIWAARSLSFYYHLTYQLYKGCINNVRFSIFQIPHLPYITQNEWIRSSQIFFELNGFNYFVILTISLIPFIWSLSDAIFFKY